MSGQKLRQLGNLEKFSVARVFLGLDTCIAMAAKYTTAENTPLTKEILFPALRTVVENHPILGVRVEGKHTSTDVAFFRLPSVDLSRVVQFSETNDVRAALERWFMRRFEDSVEDMPLWRVEVLSDNTVIFAMHHGAGDGISLSAFHKSLFRALQQPVYTESSDLVTVPDKPLAPPIEAIIDVRPSLWTTLDILFHALLPTYWNRDTYTWSGKPCPLTAFLQTQVRLLSFSPSQTDKFSQLCRSHNATVSSALYELSVSVLSRLVAQTPEGAKYQTVDVEFPISLRGVTGTPDDVFHYCASSYNSYPSLQGTAAEFSWSRAARVATTLKTQQTASVERLGFLSWVAGNYEKFMNGYLGRKRMVGLRISNAGRFVVEDKGPWRIGATFFGQCDSVIGPAIIMTVTGTPEGGLNFTFTWGKESVEGTFVEEFIGTFREVLLGL
ncbi:alcohol acetyltransferase [Roridomyces roridus]|uniref:Alcohol acetyltransferase n=1 Tax=Roridomyces roridus TaxID=1738132 RepID=A0AAD7C7G5_9AGAR|nr:alcohol acetyltransferase [Roridomyces roridus]